MTVRRHRVDLSTLIGSGTNTWPTAGSELIRPVIFQRLNVVILAIAKAERWSFTIGHTR